MGMCVNMSMLIVNCYVYMFKCLYMCVCMWMDVCASNRIPSHPLHSALFALNICDTGIVYGRHSDIVQLTEYKYEGPSQHYPRYLVEATGKSHHELGQAPSR